MKLNDQMVSTSNKQGLRFTIDKDTRGEQDFSRELERKVLDYVDGWMTWRRDRDTWIQRKLYAESYERSRIRFVEYYQGDLTGKSILDLGCGMGGFSVALAMKGAYVVPVEPSMEHLEITKLRFGKHGFLSDMSTRGVGENLPFSDESFDIVCALQVLEHVQDPLKVLAEVNRVLRPGGRAFITYIRKFAIVEPHYFLPFLTWLPREFADKVVKISGRCSERQPTGRLKPSEMHYFSHRAFYRMARQTGFSTCRTYLEDLVAEISPRDTDSRVKKMLKKAAYCSLIKGFYVVVLSSRRASQSCVLIK